MFYYFNKLSSIQTVMTWQFCNDNYLVGDMENNKQLLDEVEHDIMNYQNRGLCYLPKPKAEANNTNTRF